MPLPTHPETVLERAGEYFVELDLPDRILRAINNRPNWAVEFAAFVLERTNRRVEVEGGGVSWTDTGGGPARRVFSLRISVAEKAQLSTQTVGVLTAGLIGFAVATVLLVSATVVGLYYLADVFTSPGGGAAGEAAAGFADALNLLLLITGGVLLYRLFDE